MAQDLELQDLLKERVRDEASLTEAFVLLGQLAGGSKPAMDRARVVWLDGEEEDDDLPIVRVGPWVESLGEKPEPTVHGLIEPNTITILSADPKAGKTFLALQIADDIASGRPVFGKWETIKPGPVVYFSMEDPDHLFGERCTARGMTERNPPVFIVKGPKDISTPAGMDWLVKKVEPIQPVLIVIDTAREAFDADNWNDAVEVKRRLAPLRAASRRFANGCAFLVVAHNNKNSLAEGGNRVSGSNALVSTVDSFIVLSDSKRMACGDLTGKATAQGRIDIDHEWSWRMDHDTLFVRVLDEQETVAMNQQNRADSLAKRLDRVERAIIAKDWEATVAEIAEHTGLAERTIRDTITEGKRAGRIIEVGKRQHDGAGRPLPVFGIAAGITAASIYKDRRNSGDGETGQPEPEESL